MEVVTHPLGCRPMAGLTLIEIIVTLCVGLILLGIGLPAYRTLSANNQLSSEINNFIRHLHLARSTAVKTGTHAILCPTADRQHCLDEPRWTDGFMLYLDHNRNRLPDPHEKRVRYSIPTGRIKISMTSTMGRKRIIYRTDGRSAGSNLTLTFCDPEDLVPAKAIILSNVGRPRVSKTRADGSPLNCET